MAQREVGGALSEERALRARVDESARRVTAARASLDSILPAAGTE